MKGNITGTTYAGGIVGESYGNYGSFGPFDVMNYMTGNIVSTNNTSGGIVGYASKRTSSYTLSISNAVNAMNGTVDDAAVGTTTIVTTVSMKIDTSFGLTYTTANYGSTSDTFTGTTSTLFPSLSYTPFVFTDNASNSYEYEMVFGNVGGNSSYSQYTHAIISKGDVAGPYFVDFDLTPDTTEYITYVSIDSYASVYTDGSLAVLDSSAVVVFDYAGSTVLFGGLPSALGITSVGAVDAAVSITPVPTAVSYQLRYVPTSGGTPVITTFTELTRVVNGLGPETEYEISLYYLPSGSSIYTLDSSKTATTLENTPANYDLSIYGSGGEYDLSGISDLGNLSEVMNDLFATGDELTINLNGSAEKVSLVKVGETVALPESSILFPFTSSNGAGQAVTLTLPDTTTQTVTYNDSSEEITVGGTTYADGDTFVLGGKKATVVNV